MQQGKWVDARKFVALSETARLAALEQLPQPVAALSADAARVVHDALTPWRGASSRCNGSTTRTPGGECCSLLPRRPRRVPTPFKAVFGLQLVPMHTGQVA